MLVLLCRQASTDCLVLVEVGVETVSIEDKKRCFVSFTTAPTDL